MSKDLYIAELERIAAELEDQGVPADKVYDIASERAYPAMRERLAAMADMARKKYRGE
ncbi:MAG: hypothetical protein KGL39_04855 [Patescibacteria group bacterium]|nr:hypothetical protein [Patescibacteria group bacterium]